MMYLVPCWLPTRQVCQQALRKYTQAKVRPMISSVSNAARSHRISPASRSGMTKATQTVVSANPGSQVPDRAEIRCLFPMQGRWESASAAVVNLWG